MRRSSALLLLLAACASPDPLPGAVAVRGRAVFVGEKVPRRKKVVCVRCEVHVHTNLRTEDEIVNPKNRGIQNVLVWVRHAPVEGGAEAAILAADE